MKKLIFALVSIITICFFFSSCNNTTKGPGVDVVKRGCNTIIQEPVLEPRYDCKGKRLPHDKFLGMRKVGCMASPNSIQSISDYDLNERGYFYDKNRRINLLPIDNFGNRAGQNQPSVGYADPIPSPSFYPSGIYDEFGGWKFFWSILPWLLFILIMILPWFLFRNRPIVCSITDAISKAANNKQDVELILRIKNPISDPKNQKRLPDNMDNSGMD